MPTESISVFKFDDFDFGKILSPQKKKSAKHHPNIHPQNLNQGFFLI